MAVGASTEATMLTTSFCTTIRASMRCMRLVWQPRSCLIDCKSSDCLGMSALPYYNQK